MKNITIGVIGLGYVGLPVAVSFARSGFSVIGYDIDERRIAELQNGYDRTDEVETQDPGLKKATFSSSLDDLDVVNFFIVTVPTPIDNALRPDLSPLKSASQTVGKVLKKGDIVVYESTVYPGVTEDECVPILESVSGLRCGEDFKVGYSPERINPGDKQRRLENITKIVSGQDADALKVISKVYGAIITAGIHEAPNIKTAEAAKVIENTQRDLNISLINELALIFHRLGIDTTDVLEAAGTKWNFLRFTPGLVGGHCIGVDPYYLTHKAQQMGYYPEVIHAGRRLNDGMVRFVASQCIKQLLLQAQKNAGQCVTILGLSFKENVPDLRNSRVVDIVRELETYGIDIQVHDPLADKQEAWEEYGINLCDYGDLKPANVVILAVAHTDYRNRAWGGIIPIVNQNGGSVLDLKNCLAREEKPDHISLWRL